jgi:hypothetical protein
MFVTIRGIKIRTSQEFGFPFDSGCNLPPGCCNLHCVVLTISFRHLLPPQEIPNDDMALIHAAHRICILMHARSRLRLRSGELDPAHY